MEIDYTYNLFYVQGALQDMTKKPAEETKEDGVSQNIWSEDFLKEAAAQFETNMASILGTFSGVPGEVLEFLSVLINIVLDFYFITLFSIPDIFCIKNINFLTDGHLFKDGKQMIFICD